MSTVLGTRWGGAVVSRTVTHLLLRAQYAAVCERSAEIRVRHVLTALGESDGPPAEWRAALTAAGFPATALAWTPPVALRPPPVGGDPAEPPLPGTELLALLRALPAWARYTGDPRATSVHLVAALAAGHSSTARLTVEEAGSPFHQLGLTADAMLSSAARHHLNEPDEDTGFARYHAGEAEDFPLPMAPTTEELSTHTGRRGSPLLARYGRVDGIDDGAAFDFPLGRRRLNAISLLSGLGFLMSVCSALALIVTALGSGPWWIVLGIILVFFQSVLRTWLAAWLVGRAVLVWLLPEPLGWVVPIWMLIDFLYLYHRLWMHRVEMADPELTRKDLSRRNRGREQDAHHDLVEGGRRRLARLMEGRRRRHAN